MIYECVQLNNTNTMLVMLTMHKVLKSSYVIYKDRYILYYADLYVVYLPLYNDIEIIKYIGVYTRIRSVELVH